MKQNELSVNLFKIDSLTIQAINLIKRFITLNESSIKLPLIYFDFTSKLLGYYNYSIATDKYKIFVNPVLCATNAYKDNNIWPKSINDSTIYGTIVHEFCHLITYTTHKVVLIDYYAKFSCKDIHLILNKNSLTSNEEECIEVFTLFLINPLLLKKISLDFFNFFNSYFVSPSLIKSYKTVKNIYAKFPNEIKQKLLNDFGVSF